VPCAVCTWYVKTRSAGFLVEPQNQGRRFVSGLASKPVVTVFTGLASKPVVTVFSSLASKLVATVSWFGPQNQEGFGLSVAPQNRRREIDAEHALRSSGLLYVEASLDRVFQSGLKTGGGAMTGGARDTITEVTSEAS
jgi:hypothetical protein